MRFSKALIIVLAILFISSFIVLYAEDIKREAKVIGFKGKVDVMLSSQQQWVPAKKGMALTEGDMIKTAKGAEATLNVNGSGQTANVVVDENAELRLMELVKEKGTGVEKTMLDLAIGEILIKAEKLDSPESKFEVKTPTSVVGVRGTKFSVKVEALD